MPHSDTKEWLRFNAYKREGGRCFYCDRPVDWHKRKDHVRDPDAMSLDHVIPMSKGGRWAIGNIVCACHSCNQERRDMDAAEFLKMKAAYQRGIRRG